MAIYFSILVLFAHFFFNDGSCVYTVIRGGWPMDSSSMHIVYSRYMRQGERFIDWVSVFEVLLYLLDNKLEIC